jgi:hypothetical protein
VSGQSALAVEEVEVRCDRCARDLADRAPLLAKVQRDPPYLGGTWHAFRFRRAQDRERAEPGTPPSQRKLRPRGGFESLDHQGSATLPCRRCHAKPRMKVHDLIDLAAHAAAEGRRIAYC